MAGEYIPGQPGINPLTNDSRTATRGPNGLRDDWVERERLKREVAADLGQLALDIAGIIDPTPLSDGTSALISLARGRWTDALISAVSIVPYIGDISKIGKLGRYSGSIRQAILLARVDLEWAGHLRPLFIKLKKPLDTLLEVGADKLPDRSRRYLQQMRDEIDRFIGPQRVLRKPGAKSPGARQGGGDSGKTGPGPKKPKKTGGSLRSREKTDTINDAGGGAKNRIRTPKPSLAEIKLAKSSGNTAAHIAARDKVARHYLENNGFSEGQILEALGSPNNIIKGGVDLEKPLEIAKFPPPDIMYQHVKSHGNPGNWFDPIGNQTTDSLGINGATRTPKGFKVPEGDGLLSTSKPILDNWTVPGNPVQTKGGGIQIFVNDQVKNNTTSIK